MKGGGWGEPENRRKASFGSARKVSTTPARRIRPDWSKFDQIRLKIESDQVAWVRVAGGPALGPAVCLGIARKEIGTMIKISIRNGMDEHTENTVKHAKKA